MPNDNINRLLEQLEDEIKRKHPDTRLEFSVRDFDDLENFGELWVYVLDLDKYESVERQCQELTKQHEQGTPAVRVFARTWTGPWPGGQSEAELKKRREEFREKIKSRSP